MGGLNKTGVPSTDNYNLGRGRIYAALLDANDAPISYRDLGNCPEFTIGLETETLEHQSSRSGLRVTDKEVILSQKVNLNITLDNIEFDNLATFFSASKTEFGSPSGIMSDVVLTPLANGAVAVDEYIAGKWFDLVDSSGARIYGIDSTISSGIVFQIDTASAFSGPTTLVLTTDYTVDETMGRVLIYNSATIAALSGIPHFLQYTLPASGNPGQAVDELQLFQQTSAAVAIKFIAENPANADEQTEWQFHKVTLKAEGDVSMIGDDWSQLPMTGVAEEAAAVDADAPVGYARHYVQ